MDKTIHILSRLGVAFRSERFSNLIEQIAFCRKYSVAHLQLQMRRLGGPLSLVEKNMLHAFVREVSTRSLSSHLSSPEFDRDAHFINKDAIFTEIEEVAGLPIQKITIHPGKFEGAHHEVRERILPHLFTIVQHARHYRLITCFENLPYKVWKDSWKQKFGVTPVDLTWLRNEIVRRDPDCEKFCKFTLDTGHVAGSNNPFRMTPEEFAELLGWEHIEIIHANDAENLKRLYGFTPKERLKDTFEKRMETEQGNKKLQTIKRMIEEDPLLQRAYDTLLSGLDTVHRAHVPLTKGSINWETFISAYCKYAKHRPEIYLELNSADDMRNSLAYFKTVA